MYSKSPYRWSLKDYDRFRHVVSFKDKQPAEQHEIINFLIDEKSMQTDVDFTCVSCMNHTEFLIGFVSKNKRLVTELLLRWG